MTIFDFIKEQKGASAIEFAIVLPLFLVLVFGIIEFGVIMYDKAVITNASREGARFGILFTDKDTTDAGIATKVNEFLSATNLISLGGGATHTITSLPATRPRGTPLSVTITYPYDFLVIPSFIPGIPQTLSLSATTIMRME